MSQDRIGEALTKAVQAVRQEEYQKPSLEKVPNDVARKAAEFGWMPGQRDMALKMHLAGKNLTEIRQEVNRSAEEIVQVLGLHKGHRRGTTTKLLGQKIQDLTEKGYPDSMIAEILNADGVRTSRGKLWTVSRVYSVRQRMKKSSQ